MATYSEYYYDRQGGGSLASAEVVVPIALEYTQPESVIDIGCGTGTWLTVFKKYGLDIFGVDGAWVSDKQLRIPKENFLAKNLEHLENFEGRADLAVSLEVAEHLPERAAEQFIEALARIAPVILFSAAIPHQGGTHHVNERWPEYWAEKFKARGYVPVDCIRRRVWRNPAVEFWYAQNTLFYVRESELPRYPKLKEAYEAGFDEALALVHPRKFIYIAERYGLVGGVAKFVPGALRRALKKALSRGKD